MAKVGRFVSDPKAGAYCQITLDSGEKIIVNHEKGGFKGGRLTIEVTKLMGFSSTRIFTCDLDSPEGKAALAELTRGVPEGSLTRRRSAPSSSTSRTAVRSHWSRRDVPRCSDSHEPPTGSSRTRRDVDTNRGVSTLEAGLTAAVREMVLHSPRLTPIAGGAPAVHRMLERIENGWLEPDGTPVHVDLHRSERPRAAIVFQPGSGAPARVYFLVAGLLAQRGYHVLAIDRRRDRSCAERLRPAGRRVGAVGAERGKPLRLPRTGSGERGADLGADR